MLQYTAFYTQILQNQPKKVNEKLKFLIDFVNEKL